MKRFYVISLLLLSSFISVCARDILVHIRKDNFEDIKKLFQCSELVIHYYSDNEIIGTLRGDIQEQYTLIDETPWEKGEQYFLVNNKITASSVKEIMNESDTMITADTRLILVKRNEEVAPPRNDSLIHVANIVARLPVFQDYSRFLKVSSDISIQNLVDSVDHNRIQSDIQTLQNFVTRNCYQQGGINAQLWLKNTFSAMGYSVTEQTFLINGNDVTDNIIAQKLGSKYPNEYVIVGAHYDSIISGYNQSNAPGADDNASGVAGVLEIARLLKDIEFERTVVFCAFSGEEYGLYGSAAYAQSLVSAGKSVTAYLNLDMIGYRDSSQTRHADMMAPLSASALKSYFVSTASLYVHDFSFEDGGSIGGDSDHTSFNVRGFPGVWPFEDTQYYSPYIHSTNDILGVSVNDILLARSFTQATLAVFVSLSVQDNEAPSNLTADILQSSIVLSWDALDGYDTYLLFRDGVRIAEIMTLSFEDVAVSPASVYRYSVRAKNSETGDYSGVSSEIIVRYRMPHASSMTVFPQPASQYVEINITSHRNGIMNIIVYTSNGKIVRHLHTGNTAIGYYTYVWDFRDDAGRELPSGIYYCVFTSSTGEFIRKIVRVK